MYSMAVPEKHEAGIAVTDAGVWLTAVPVLTCLNFVHLCSDGIWVMAVFSGKTIYSRLVNPLNTLPEKLATCAPSMEVGMVTDLMAAFGPSKPVMLHCVPEENLLMTQPCDLTACL